MVVNFYKQHIKKIPIITSSSIIAASISSFLIEYMPNSILIDKYKNIIELKKYGKIVPLTKNVENLFNEVIHDLNIEESNKKYYHPFASIGFNLIHAGFCSNKYGSIIGIPVNYSYKDYYSINTSEIHIGYNQDQLNISHPAANNLLDSLLLSDKAKKFGIAREILMINQNLSLYRSIESPVMILLTVFTGEYLRIKLKKSFMITFPLKAIIFGLTGLLGYSLWFQIRDSLNIFYEKYVDEQLAKINPDYFEGGKEFYEKLLKKNIALRELLGDNGAKEFNKDGDEITFIRRKRTPLTERKQFFNDFTFSNYN